MTKIISFNQPRNGISGLIGFEKVVRVGFVVNAEVVTGFLCNVDVEVVVGLICFVDVEVVTGCGFVVLT